MSNPDESKVHGRVTAARRVAGYTLIELMVTIAILAILLTIAVPSFSSYQNNQRIRSASEGLVSALNFARSEAVKRAVSIPPIAPTITKVEPVTAGAWADGWTVKWFDPDPSKMEWVPLADYAAANGVTITASSTTSPAYNSDGRLSTSSTLSFTVAPVSGSATPACVRVTLSGKATINRSGACS